MDNSEPIIENNKKRCVACSELIMQDASLCPHCLSPQSPQRWKRLGVVVKWFAGTTAIITLIIGTIQVNRIFQDWKEREDAVHELVKASNIWSKSEDYEGAWKLLDQAFKLKPSSKHIIQTQAMIAMEWLRNIKLEDVEDERDEQRFYDNINNLLPVLHRAGTSNNLIFAADALAHIGWANYLRYLQYRGNKVGDIDEYFTQALTKDPNNLYAHVMWGTWILNRYNEKKYDTNKLEKAKHHFSASLMSGKKSVYIKKIQANALFTTNVAGAALELIKLLDQLRKTNEVDKIIDKYLGHNYIRAFLWIDGIHGIGLEKEETEKLLARLFTELKPQECLATFLWLQEKYDISAYSGHYGPYYEYILARLMEGSDDIKTALKHYTTIHKNIQEGSIRVAEDKFKELVEKKCELVTQLLQKDINE